MLQLNGYIQAFVDAVNCGDVDRIHTLLSEDHVFIDSLGMEVHGRDRMRQAWEGYFKLVPDYSIEIHDVFGEGGAFVLIGIASGTYAPEGIRQPEHVWSVPAAWRVRVLDGRITFWQVFADNEPIRRIMRGEVEGALSDRQHLAER